jgi:midasin
MIIIRILILSLSREGKLASIDSYMEHFPFQHYIVLRDVETLPHTLSDALRQWFELVTS